MKRSFAVLFLFFAATFASAQVGDCASLTHQALELSGFNQSLDRITDVLSSPQFMQQIRGRESAEDFIAIFLPLMQKEFNADLLRKEMQQRLFAKCDPEQMALTVQRLQTPLMAKMLALEAATNTPEGQEKLKKYARIASSLPLTDERLEALDAVDNSMGASDFATDTIMAVMTGMMTGVAMPQELVTQLQEHRSEMKAQMQNSVELSMSVTYHGVTRPELQQYAKEIGAQPLKGFYLQVDKSFVEIVQERALALGQDLKEAIAARKN
ncbi:MAG TPA: hypothetical protein VGN44_07150 [Candidatus Angelobacter sp.]|jgi:hypothetical protein